jgi:hypothetical protein
MLAKSIALSAVYAAVVSAQNASAGVSFSPAAEIVDINVTPANLSLFETETVQLTDNVITAIKEHHEYAEYALLFEFGDSPSSKLSARTRRAREAARCKTMPGDPLYPNKAEWSLFDFFLGDALEKIIPIGSPCYKQSEYNNYDAARCAELVKDWNTEEI